MRSYKQYQYMGVALEDDGIDLRIQNPELKSGRVDYVTLTTLQAHLLLEDLTRALRRQHERDARKENT